MTYFSQIDCFSPANNLLKTHFFFFRQLLAFELRFTGILNFIPSFWPHSKISEKTILKAQAIRILKPIGKRHRLLQPCVLWSALHPAIYH